MNFTEDKNLIKETITLSNGDHSFDFTVTCTIFGEVISTQNHFFELPEYAQKLVLGKPSESIFAQVKLLSFRIPLGYLAKICFEDHVDMDFSKLIEKIFEKKKQLGLSKGDIIFKYIQENWCHELYQIFITKSNINDRKIKGIKALLKIFGKEENKKREGLEEVKRFKLKLSEPILTTIIPTLEMQIEKVAAYKAFTNYISRANYDFLINQFEKENSKPVRSAIIEGIQNYKGPKNFNFILKQYKNNAVDTQCVLKAFSLSKKPEAEKILWKHFENFEEGENSRIARQSLLKIGISEKRIAQKLTPAFYKAERILPIQNIISHFATLQNYYLYPPPEDILKKIKEYIEKTVNSDIDYTVAEVTAPRHNKKIPKIIDSFIYNSNINLQILGIQLISRYLTDHNFLVKPSQYEKSTDRLIQLYNQDQEVGYKRVIIDCLGAILKYNKKPALLETLIKFGNESDNDLEKIGVAIALKNSSEILPISENIFQFLSKSINSENVNLRIALIRTLVKFESPKITPLIEHFKNDEYNEIRDIANGIDSWQDYFKNRKMKRKNERKANSTLSKKTKFFIEAKLNR